MRLCLRSLMNVSVMATTSIDAAVQPERGVDVVGEQIACYAAAGDGGVQTPEAFPALRQILRRWSSPAGTWCGSGRFGRGGLRRSGA